MKIVTNTHRHTDTHTDTQISFRVLDINHESTVTSDGRHRGLMIKRQVVRSRPSIPPGRNGKERTKEAGETSTWHKPRDLGRLSCIYRL